MRQITLQKPGFFTLDSVPDPVTHPNLVRVAVRRVGICGTDLHAFAGRQPFFRYPRVLGHELAVEVMDTPPGTHGVKPGDLCAVEPYLNCGTCPMCLARRSNACTTLQCLGVHTDGGMVDTLTIRPEKLFPSATLTMDQLALVETLGIGFHAVERAQLVPGMAVLVVGAGPIGLSILPFAKTMGVTVRVLERAPHRRAFAERFGVNATETLGDFLPDVVFDCTGNAESMANATNLVAPGGTIIFVGLVNGAIPLDDPMFHRKELTLKASRNSVGAFPKIMRMIETGVVDTTPWITHRLKLEELPTRFEGLSREAGLIKAMVDL